MAELKRHTITLVKEVKEGELVTETYVTPVFIPMKAVYEAIDLAAEMRKEKDQRKLIDKMMTFVADKVYNKQFPKEALISGLHGPDAVRILEDQILFVSRGFQNEESKKYLEKKN